MTIPADSEMRRLRLRLERALVTRAHLKTLLIGVQQRLARLRGALRSVTAPRKRVGQATSRGGALTMNARSSGSPRQTSLAITNTEWAAELAIALYGSEWVIDTARIMEGASKCVALLHRSGRKGWTQIDLRLDVFETPARRKTETFRQLAAR